MSFNGPPLRRHCILPQCARYAVVTVYFGWQPSDFPYRSFRAHNHTSIAFLTRLSLRSRTSSRRPIWLCYRKSTDVCMLWSNHSSGVNFPRWCPFSNCFLRVISSSRTSSLCVANRSLERQACTNAPHSCCHSHITVRGECVAW